MADDEQSTRAVGRQLALRLNRGDAVLLEGDLGAGKTTLVRGILEGLGFSGLVRSPTFNLLQAFDTEPPVLHADLYRVKGIEGLGIEEYLATHVCLVEWADRAEGFFGECWHVKIDFEGNGRRIVVLPPVASD